MRPLPSSHPAGGTSWVHSQFENLSGRRARGPLPVDDALAVARQLAADLEVNPNTVAKAYSLLEREGLVRTAGRRGTIVAPSAGSVARKTVGKRLDEAIDRLIEETAGLGVDLDEIVQGLRRRGRRRSGRRSE